MPPAYVPENLNQKPRVLKAIQSDANYKKNKVCFKYSVLNNFLSFLTNNLEKFYFFRKKLLLLKQKYKNTTY